MRGIITDIKRFAVHDGDGIRTTVFLKGCPLRCVWCHNPEGLKASPQLAFFADKCVHCGKCISRCPVNAHTMLTGKHQFSRNVCDSCGQCVAACYVEALHLFGTEVTVEDLLPKLLEDRDFFETTGGGVTLSGGECLIQPQFCGELLKALKEQGIHTAVDTCGFAPWSSFEAVLPYTDVFLYDVKAMDEDVHIRCTGQSNIQILENLRRLDEAGASIEVRIPYVPEWNQNQMEKIRVFLSGLSRVNRVRVLPYHSYAGSKYHALGMASTLPQKLPTPKDIEQIQSIFT